MPERRARRRVAEKSSTRAPIGYPVSALECDLVTSTGVKLHLRPIAPATRHDSNVFMNDSPKARSIAATSPYIPSSPRRRLRISPHSITRIVSPTSCSTTRTSSSPWVATTESREPTDAEVAFVVIDHYQHHGIGILLLWHLARAARPNGITHFVAETQADNRGMLGVFRDSGYPVTSTSTTRS